MACVRHINRNHGNPLNSVVQRFGSLPRTRALSVSLQLSPAMASPSDPLPALPAVSPSISFSACGMRWPYHVGVGQYIHDNLDLSDARIAITSGGAFAGSVLSAGLDPRFFLGEIYPEFEAYWRSRRLGCLLDDGEAMLNILRRQIELLHVDVRALSGKLHIGMTRLPSLAHHIQSQFGSENDVLMAGFATVCIPLITARRLPVVDGSYCVDGGFRSICPRLDEHTVRSYVAFPQPAFLASRDRGTLWGMGPVNARHPSSVRQGGKPTTRDEDIAAEAASWNPYASLGALRVACTSLVSEGLWGTLQRGIALKERFASKWGRGWKSAEGRASGQAPSPVETAVPLEPLHMDACDLLGPSGACTPTCAHSPAVAKKGRFPGDPSVVKTPPASGRASADVPPISRSVRKERAADHIEFLRSFVSLPSAEMIEKWMAYGFEDATLAEEEGEAGIFTWRGWKTKDSILDPDKSYDVEARCADSGADTGYTSPIAEGALFAREE